MKKSYSFLKWLFILVILIPMFSTWQKAEAASIKVTATSFETPGFYWCQHLDGHWSTSDGSHYTASDAGGQPETKLVQTQADVRAPSTFRDSMGNSYSASEVTGVKPVESVPKRNRSGDESWISGGKVYIKGYTGPGYPVRYDVDVCGDNQDAVYPFQIEVTWEGYVEQARTCTLSISPSFKSMNIGDKTQLTARVTWSDTSTSTDVTNSVSWSSNSSAAYVSRGTVTANDSTFGGYVTIAATYSSDGTSCSDTAEISIAGSGNGGGSTEPPSGTVVGFEVSPEEIEIKVGEVATFKAYDVYSNGARKDVTSIATWSASNSTVGTMSGLSKGQVKGKTKGKLIMTATKGGRSDTGTLNVTESGSSGPKECREDLFYNPDEGTIQKDEWIRLTFVYYVSPECTTEEVPGYEFESSDPEVAHIELWGDAQGHKIGTTTISAGYLSARYDDDLRAEYTLHVEYTPINPVSLSIRPANNMRVKDKQIFKAYLLYSDGHEEEVTSKVTWELDNKSIADFTGNEFAPTEVEGKASGNFTISASLTAPVEYVDEKAETMTTEDEVFSASESIKVSDFTLWVEPVIEDIFVGEVIQTQAVIKWEDVNMVEDKTSEAVWTVADPSIVSLESNGRFAGEKKGSTTYTVSYYGKTVTYTINVHDFSLDISPKDAEFMVNELFRYSFKLIPSNGDPAYEREIDPRDIDYIFTPEDVEQLQYAYLKGKKDTTVNVQATYDGVYSFNLPYSTSTTVRFKPHTPVPVITSPDKVYMWQEFDIDGLDSTSGNGEIVHYQWEINGVPSTTLTEGEATTHFEKEGDYVVKLTVTDNLGKIASTTKTITVLPNYPTANIAVGGELKENRKTTLVASLSKGSVYGGFAIDHTKNEWEVIPLNGQNPSGIKIVNVIDKEKVDVLYRQSGDYKIRLRVTNEKGNSSTWGESTITISPDLPPTIEISAGGPFYRDPANDLKATLPFSDSASSPDLDLMGGRKWYYRFNPNLDGDFVSIPWSPIPSSDNLSNVQLEVTSVGQYQVKVEITEEYGQDTIPEFFDPSLRKMASDTATVVVDNKYPTASFTDVSHRKKADLFFMVGDDVNISGLDSKLEQRIRQKLNDENIDITIKRMDE